MAGSLAQKKARAGAALQGVLVQQGGRHTVVAAQDLPAYTSLHPGRILQRQILSLRKPFAEVRLHLNFLHPGRREIWPARAECKPFVMPLKVYCCGR